MALIEKMDQGFKTRNAIHKAIDDTYFIITNKKGEKFLQIDTYGSDEREFPGKVSQSLQFSPKAIEQLKEILRVNF